MTDAAAIFSDCDSKGAEALRRELQRDPDDRTQRGEMNKCKHSGWFVCCLGFH